MRRYTVRINETDYTLDVEEAARDQFVVHLGDRVVNVTLVDHADVAPDEIADGPGAARNVAAAPMPGVVLSVEVAPGAVVACWAPAWTLNGRLLKPAVVVVAGKSG